MPSKCAASRLTHTPATRSRRRTVMRVSGPRTTTTMSRPCRALRTLDGAEHHDVAAGIVGGDLDHVLADAGDQILGLRRHGQQQQRREQQARLIAAPRARE